jgi:hypothetical protein
MRGRFHESKHQKTSSKTQSAATRCTVCLFVARLGLPDFPAVSASRGKAAVTPIQRAVSV